MRCSVVRVTPQRANSRCAASRICCRVCSDSCLVRRTVCSVAVEFTYTSDCIIIPLLRAAAGAQLSSSLPTMPPFENETEPRLRLLSSYAAQCSAALIVAGLLVGCGRDAAAPAAPAPVSVHMLTVEPRKVPIRFDIVGQIEGSKQVEVRARVPGILQKQFYNEGDSVKEGAPLFEIDRATYEVALAQARAQLAQATAQVDQARREEARLKPLLQDRAVRGKEYDDATSLRQLSEAAIKQANASIRQAELNLSYTRVTAPLAGVSGRAEHSIGTLIATDVNGSLLTTINQMSTVWVRFSLAQADLAKLPGGYLNQIG